MTAIVETSPPGLGAADDAGSRLLAEVRARAEKQITSVLHLVAERDAAIARAVKAQAEAAALVRVNLELQTHLDEYNHHDRPAYERRIAELEAENERLRGLDTLVLPKYTPTRRGGWRRSR